MIVGDGLLLPKLKARVEELGIQDKVIFTGFLQPEELRVKVLNAVAGFLLIENLGLSYYYALGNKFFDYVQGGIPQISINFPEYQLLHNKYGLSVLVDSLAPEEIARKANQLLDDPELLQSLQKKTRAAQEDLSWEKQEEILLAFYDNLN